LPSAIGRLVSSQTAPFVRMFLGIFFPVMFAQAMLIAEQRPA
jgi:hypothetical protein